MSDLKVRQQPVEKKEVRARPPKAFAGREALVSSIIEAGEGCEPVRSSFGFLVTSQSLYDCDSKVEGHLGALIGVPVTVLPEGHPDRFIGMDEADRFIAGVEKKKRR